MLAVVGRTSAVQVSVSLAAVVVDATAVGFNKDWFVASCVEARACCTVRRAACCRSTAVVNVTVRSMVLADEHWAIASGLVAQQPALQCAVAYRTGSAAVVVFPAGSFVD